MTQTPSDDREVGVHEPDVPHLSDPRGSLETASHDTAGASGDRPPELVGGPPRTGDPAVDAALSAAAAVQDAAPAAQLDAYVGTHRALQDRLADSGG